MIVSGIKQNDSVIHIHVSILFQILLGCYIILRRVPCEHRYVPVYVYVYMCVTLHYILTIFVTFNC